MAIDTSTVLAEDAVRPGMILISGGTFLMGCDQGGDFERPVHDVHVDPFWIDQTLVSNQQFCRFAAESGYQTEAERIGEAWGYRHGRFEAVPGLCWRSFATEERGDHPVVLVTWADAMAYARWAGKRLPTEAEWEKAARGGLVGADYPWGDSTPDGSQCNFARTPAEVPPTVAPGTFPPNGFGLIDMVGNVWQWCSDWFSETTYVTGPCANPTGPPVGQNRVRRGGSWNVIQPFRLRCANRGAIPPATAVPNLGFRCAASASRVDG
jgi:formylglycine-generating enzyme required for sulfatase activity